VKLIISIVSVEDAGRLLDALMASGYRATRIASSGGFLRRGNATIFLGTEDDKVPHALELIRANCETRSQLVNPLPPVMEPGEMYVPAPVRIEVGGATVCVLDVAQFVHF
jgi:uncharacterized protein YaaQ